jgi:predicted nucleotide-binding protein
MPTLSRTYSRCIFKTEVIQESVALAERMSIEKIDTLNEKEKDSVNKYGPSESTTHSLVKGTDNWRHGSVHEFFSDYRKGFDRAEFDRSVPYFSINLSAYSLDYATPETIVRITAPSRAELERLLEIFEHHAAASFISKKEEKPPSPIIFIGHGKSGQWRELKDHLLDKHHYCVEAYEVGARAGHTIRDILGEMLTKSSFAVIVMTAEDETADGKFNPRLNVVHELGLFQGKLGFSRAIVLLEEGTEEFSNIHGIQQIRYNKGNIKETFGEVLATLKREFP